jgi:hypothetical protein
MLLPHGVIDDDETESPDRALYLPNPQLPFTQTV